MPGLSAGPPPRAPGGRPGPAGVLPGHRVSPAGKTRCLGPSPGVFGPTLMPWASTAGGLLARAASGGDGDSQQSGRYPRAWLAVGANYGDPTPEGCQGRNVGRRGPGGDLGVLSLAHFLASHGGWAGHRVFGGPARSSVTVGRECRAVRAGTPPGVGDASPSSSCRAVAPKGYSIQDWPGG